MTQHRTIGDNPALADILPGLPNATVSHAYFASPESLAVTCAAMSKNHAWEDSAWTADSDFTGTASMDETLRLCRDGWDKGAEHVARLRDKIMIENPTQARFVRWDVAGAYPSVPRAVSGNPLHMRRKDYATAHKRPVITLAHHCGGTVSIEPQTFMNKAAVVAAIVDVAESAGYSVELIACSVSQTPPQGNAKVTAFAHETAVTVKAAGDVVDVARMAFAIGHPSFFRRMIFAVRSIDSFNRPLGSALGRTMDYPADTIPAGTYVLPSLNTCEDKFKSEQAATTAGLAFYLDTLAKQACPPFVNRLAA